VYLAGESNHPLAGLVASLEGLGGDGEEHMG